jgi:hypothetical protein
MVDIVFIPKKNPLPAWWGLITDVVDFRGVALHHYRPLGPGADKDTYAENYNVDKKYVDNNGFHWHLAF